MSGRTPLGSLKQMSEINLTPLMDLTFILLITFIITFPLIEQGISVQLPVADAPALEPDQAVAITIDRDGHVFLGDARLSWPELAGQIALLGRDPSTTFMIRADEHIAYRDVMRVLRLLQAEGVTRMALVTRDE